MAAAVDRVAVRVGIAGGIEPVERHPLAEVRAGEQAVDELFVGIGRFVGDERFDLFGGGRQAGEVERKAADERAAIGFRRRLQFLGVEAREDEVIDFISRPGFVRKLRAVSALTGGMNDQCLA